MANDTNTTAERNELKYRDGVVTSAKADKTIKVQIAFQTKHPKYGKYINRRTVLQCHDANGEAGEGDKVRIAECRPMSKTKHHRLVKVLEKAPGTS